MLRRIVVGEYSCRGCEKKERKKSSATSRCAWESVKAMFAMRPLSKPVAAGPYPGNDVCNDICKLVDPAVKESPGQQWPSYTLVKLQCLDNFPVVEPSRQTFN